MLQLYLDKLDEDIKQTTEAGFAMSLKAKQTLQENNDLIQEHIKVLERNNIVHKLRIKELEVVNQSLRLRLARAEKIPRAMAPHWSTRSTVSNNHEGLFDPAWLDSKLGEIFKTL